jgi:hypothetical protein
MHTLTNEKGSAMIISLLVLLMLGVIGVAAIQTSNTEMDIARNYQTDMKSFYAAEAGAELAFTVIHDTLTWRAGFNDYPFADGRFDVSIIDSTSESALTETLLVRSTGYRAEAVSHIELKLAPRRPFKWAVLGDKWLKGCGGTSTDSYNSDSGSYYATRLNAGGDIGSNGNIKLCGTSDIYGNASTSSPGDMDIANGAVVSGDTTTVAPVVKYDPIPQSEFDYAMANNAAKTGMKGSYKYNPMTYTMDVQPGQTVVLNSGTYYFSELKINGNIELAPGASVQIYITGDISVQSGSAINSKGAPKDFLMFAQGGTFKFNGLSEIHAALYAPQTDFALTGGGQLFGSFITKTGQDVGGSSFHYDRSLAEAAPLKGYDKVAWREF